MEEEVELDAAAVEDEEAGKEADEAAVTALVDEEVEPTEGSKEAGGAAAGDVSDMLGRHTKTQDRKPH